MTRRINLTPTWSAILPAILSMLEHGTNEAKAVAKSELARMADAADRGNAARRSIKKEEGL